MFSDAWIQIQLKKQAASKLFPVVPKEKKKKQHFVVNLKRKPALINGNGTSIYHDSTLPVKKTLAQLVALS